LPFKVNLEKIFFKNFILFNFFFSEENLLSGGMTTDVCIYKLQDSRFIEKYDKKANTSKMKIK
jgi:hypothetical protein